MKHILDYLNEEFTTPDIDNRMSKYIESSLGIPRSKMPQLDDNEFDSYIRHFASKYKLTKLKMPIKDLLPTQGELDSSKLMTHRMNNTSTGKMKFFVSNDLRITDGHHRHYANLIKDPDQEAIVYKTNLPIDKLLRVLKSMKSTKIDK